MLAAYWILDGWVMRSVEAMCSKGELDEVELGA